MKDQMVNHSYLFNGHTKARLVAIRQRHHGRGRVGRRESDDE